MAFPVHNGFPFEDQGGFDFLAPEIGSVSMPNSPHELSTIGFRLTHSDSADSLHELGFGRTTSASRLSHQSSFDSTASFDQTDPTVGFGVDLGLNSQMDGLVLDAEGESDVLALANMLEQSLEDESDGTASELTHSPLSAQDGAGSRGGSAASLEVPQAQMQQQPPLPSVVAAAGAQLPDGLSMSLDHTSAAQLFRRRTYSDSHLRHRSASPPLSRAGVGRVASTGSLDRRSPTPQSPRLSRRRGSIPRLLPYPQSPLSPSSPLAASAKAASPLSAGLVDQGPGSGRASSNGSPRLPRRNWPAGGVPAAGAGAVTCEHCNQVFANLDLLAEHQCAAAPQYNVESMLACDECHKRYAGNKIVERRLRWFRRLPEPSWQGRNCEICGLTLNIDNPRADTSSNAKKVHECKICNKVFTRGDRLLAHARIHTGKKAFACPCCPRSFSRKDRLKKHQQQHALLLCSSAPSSPTMSRSSMGSAGSPIGSNGASPIPVPVTSAMPSFDASRAASAGGSYYRPEPARLSGDASAGLLMEGFKVELDDLGFNSSPLLYPMAP